MTTDNGLTPKAVAALLVIGDKILSGRTKDKNIGYIAEYLTALGINLKEVRVVGDEEAAIVEALNALRHRYTYVFTTGGMGPGHDDITSDCVAKAFGVPIDVDPRALAILHEWLKATGAEMSGARMRMTRIPKGADLVLNPVSGAPGFWIDNVIVMAGVPSIMQAMLDEVGPKLKTGIRMLRAAAPMCARAISLPSSARSPRPIPGWQSAAIRSSIRSMGPRRTKAPARQARGGGHAAAGAGSPIEQRVSRGVRAAGIFHRRVQEMVLYAHGRSFACELGTDPRVAPTLQNRRNRARKAPVARGKGATK
jgi:molybdenum cofactor synthesis domain-containing protein